MEPEFEPARAPAARRAWSEILRPLAADLRDGSAELSVSVVNGLREGSPDLFPTEEDFEENRASTEANIALFAALVLAGRAPHAEDIPTVDLAYVREGVRRGMPLTAFLRSLRLGQAVAWKTLLAGVEQRTDDPVELTAAADLASAWLFAYVDVLSSVAEETYVSERESWVRSAAARQRETIDTILGGGTIDGAATSSQLRYELGREHLAIVGWYEAQEEGRDSIASLEAVLGQLAQQLGSDRPLVEPLGLLAAGMWLGSRKGLPPARWTVCALTRASPPERGSRSEGPLAISPASAPATSRRCARGASRHSRNVPPERSRSTSALHWSRWPLPTSTRPGSSSRASLEA